MGAIRNLKVGTLRETVQDPNKLPPARRLFCQVQTQPGDRAVVMDKPDALAGLPTRLTTAQAGAGQLLELHLDRATGLQLYDALGAQLNA